MANCQKCFVVCALVALGCWASLADDAEQDAKATQKAFNMKEIVVTASRADALAMDAAQSVSVITDEQIMASPFERMEDIVRGMPGVYNYRHYGQQASGIQSPLDMRG